MSPQANTSARTILSVLFLLSASVAPWLTPAKVLAVLASLIGIVGGVLALSNLFHVPAKVTAVMAKILGVLQDVASDIPADTLEQAKKIAKTSAMLVLLGALVSQTTACISSAPIVPVTPANQAQVSSCENTATIHNGFVIGDFVLGGIGTGVGSAGAIVSDPNLKTGLLIAGAVSGALTAIGTAIAGYTASNYANSHCSDVVGALPLGAKGPVQQ